MLFSLAGILPLILLGQPVKAITVQSINYTFNSEELEYADSYGDGKSKSSNPSVNLKYQDLHLSQIPNPILPKEPELKPVLPQQPQTPPLQPTSPPPVPGEVPPQIPGTIRVEGFEFEGNSAFSDRQLASVTQPFTGREITFAELIAVEAAITQKYVKAGYINSGAVIAANQTFSRDGGVVKVQIIEGELEEIQVTGTRRLDPNYVRSRLEIATRKPLNRDRLLEALQLLQLDPLIANISAELQAGSRPQQSRLQVQVKEADTFSVNLFTDNNRSSSIGSFRRGMRINQANLLGLGDGLEVAYANTDGSDEIDTSYTLPVNAHNGTIRFTAGVSSTNIIEVPFNSLDIEGKSRTYQLTYRQPIVQKPNRELALGLTFSRQESETSLLNERFPLAPGANNQGETRVSALRFFQEYVQRNPRQVLAARSQFSLGTDLFGTTVNSKGPDSRFFAWRGQGQYVRLLAPETLLILRSDIQLSTNSLLSLEQMGIGGALSVRGYRQDLMLTDSGAIASAEVRIPILRVPEAKGVLQLAPFIDFGVGWNYSGEKPNPDSNSLLGTGLGLVWQMGDCFHARLDYGIPLIDVKASDKTLQEQGLYFTINYFPF
ncbi:surface antigen D15 domain-containing protein [Cylindrospermum sp. NIES-4074]|nr:surface antigen D15 domain-containing protein [Cylindrospermum sp. NIES-4074]